MNPAKLWEFNNEWKTLHECGLIYNIKVATLRTRLHNGWKMEEALRTKSSHYKEEVLVKEKTHLDTIFCSDQRWFYQSPEGDIL